MGTKLTRIPTTTRHHTEWTDQCVRPERYYGDLVMFFFFAFCGGARVRPDLVQPWFAVVIVHFLIDRFHCLRFASDPLIETFSPYICHSSY